MEWLRTISWRSSGSRKLFVTSANQSLEVMQLLRKNNNGELFLFFPVDDTDQKINNIIVKVKFANYFVGKVRKKRLITDSETSGAAIIITLLHRNINFQCFKKKGSNNILDEWYKQILKIHKKRENHFANPPSPLKRFYENLNVPFYILLYLVKATKGKD